jgi:hypothetical protein
LTVIPDKTIQIASENNLDTLAPVSGILELQVPETGRIRKRIQVTDRTNVRVELENVDVEYTLRFLKPRYPARRATLLDSPSLWFFDDWHTGKEDNRAFGRVFFGIFLFALFAIGILLGALGQMAMLIVGGAVAVWLLAVGVTTKLGSLGSRQKWARAWGYVPRLFMRKNNRLLGYLFLMGLALGVLNFGLLFWGWWYTPASADLSQLSPEAIQVVHNQQRLDNLEKHGVEATDSELVFAQSNWFVRLLAPVPGNDWVWMSRFWIMIGLWALFWIYLPVAVADEVVDTYYKVEGWAINNLEGGTQRGLIHGLVHFFAKKKLGTPVVSASNPATAGGENSFMKQLLTEVFAEGIVEGVPLLFRKVRS